MPLPPLVEPGPPLTRDEAERFARHLLLPAVGEDGQRRLRNARVAVVGAGGLGAPALLYLAAAGVGTIGIIDDDVVERSNLQRQVIHGAEDLGRPKVESAAERVLEISPDATVVRHRLRLDEANVAGVLGGYDIVLDGTDNFATRYLVSDACAALGLPLVWAALFRFDAQVAVFWSRPTDGGPGVTLRDLFPEPPAPGTVPSCAEAGVLGALCGQVGSLMANEAIKLVAGIGEPLFRRVLVIDTLNARWSELPLRARRTAPDVPAGTSGTTAERTTHAHRTPTGSSGTTAERTARTQHTTGDTPAGASTLARAGSAAPAAFTGISPDELRRRLAARRRHEDDFALVDVRESTEYAQRSIPGSRLVPLALALTEGGRRGLDPDGDVIIYCKTGPRAERAAEAFARAGYRPLVLTGGIDAWERS